MRKVIIIIITFFICFSFLLVFIGRNYNDSGFDFALDVAEAFASFSDEVSNLTDKFHNNLTNIIPVINFLMEHGAPTGLAIALDVALGGISFIVYPFILLASLVSFIMPFLYHLLVFILKLTSIFYGYIV